MEIACSSCLGSQLLLVWCEYECVVVCFSASALCQAGDLSRLYPDSRSVASGLRYICCNGYFVHHRNQSDSPWYLYLQEAGIRRRKVSPHRQHLPLCDCMCLSSWSKVSFSCRSKPTQSYIRCNAPWRCHKHRFTWHDIKIGTQHPWHRQHRIMGS